jgi:hypothetical protein
MNFRILEKSKISTNLSYVSLLNLVSCDVSRPNQEHELKLTLDLINNESKFEMKTTLKSR